jgi:hypothetical protein
MCRCWKRADQAGCRPGEDENQEETRSQLSASWTPGIPPLTSTCDSGPASGSSSHHQIHVPIIIDPQNLQARTRGHTTFTIHSSRSCNSDQASAIHLPVFLDGRTYKMRDERRTPVLTGSKKDLTGRARRVEVDMACVTFHEPCTSCKSRTQYGSRSLELEQHQIRSNQIGR